MLSAEVKRVISIVSNSNFELGGSVKSQNVILWLMALPYDDRVMPNSVNDR